MSEAIIEAVWLTLRLATLTTLALMVLGVPLAWWLARTRWPGANIIAALVAMPLVLPPTVLGFYFLLFMSQSGPLGRTAEHLGLSAPAFTFEGLLIGSIIYSLPFMVQPLCAAFTAVGESAMEAAATLRAAPLDAFFNVALPIARTGLFSGAIMTFAHTIGEFGVVLMIGGNIPGETRVLSTAIYDLVEVQDYAAAHGLAAGMIVFAFAVTFLVLSLDKNTRGAL